MECAVCGTALVRGVCPLHGIGARAGEPIESAGRRPVCIVRRITDQSISVNTDTAINFLASASVTDTDGMWSAALPGQLTVKTPGYYLLCGNVAFPASGTGYRHLWITVAGVRVAMVSLQGHTGTTNIIAVSSVALLAAADAVVMMVNTGAALACQTFAGFAPRLSAALLRYP